MSLSPPRRVHPSPREWTFLCVCLFRPAFGGCSVGLGRGGGGPLRPQAKRAERSSGLMPIPTPSVPDTDADAYLCIWSCPGDAGVRRRCRGCSSKKRMALPERASRKRAHVSSVPFPPRLVLCSVSLSCNLLAQTKAMISLSLAALLRTNYFLSDNNVNNHDLTTLKQLIIL